MKSIKWRKFVSTIEGAFYKEPQVDMTNAEWDALDSFNHVDDRDAEMRGAGPCLFTEDAIIPMMEANMPRKRYNLWMGHTNFPLTMGVDDNLIASFLGVTSFTWMNPYQFRIGIGLNFDAMEVRQSIEKYYNGKPWAKILVGPHQQNQFILISGNSEAEVENKIPLCFHDNKMENLIIRSYDE